MWPQQSEQKQTWKGGTGGEESGEEKRGEQRREEPVLRSSKAVGMDFQFSPKWNGNAHVLKMEVI